jgi:hypothetical protein
MCMINCIAKAFHVFPTEVSTILIVNAILFTRGNVAPILTLVRKELLVLVRQYASTLTDASLLTLPVRKRLE